MKEKSIHIPVSLGELIDKITILEIKLRNVLEKEKLKNINFELDLLNTILNNLEPNNEVLNLKSELLKVNRRLWFVEDKLREMEKISDFKESFIKLARSVYRLNDERYSIKREINIKYGSKIIEEKSYTNY